ncbi:MAG: IPT/TIG domain-containing protein, partial [Myxococcota bacterium]
SGPGQAQTAYQPLSITEGLSGYDNIYRLDLYPPEGTPGFEVYAVATDRLGHAAQSERVFIGTVEDTVEPRVSLLEPKQGQVLVAAEGLSIRVGVDDFGVPGSRTVCVGAVREVYDGADWVEQSQTGIHDAQTCQTAEGQLAGSMEQAWADETTFHYEYVDDLAHSDVFRRGGGLQERVKLVVHVLTPHHPPAVLESYHEVGLPIETRLYPAMSPVDGSVSQADAQASMEEARQAYVGAVDQDASPERKGPMIATFSSMNPMLFERGLGHATAEGSEVLPLTSVFYAETWAATTDDGEGQRFVYDANAVSSVFVGTFMDVKAGDNVLFASKSGVLTGSGSFVDVSAWSAGGLGDAMQGEPYYHSDGLGGELVVLGLAQEANQFGLPYRLKGRAEMPYADVYGLDISGNLAFVANGHGGVQVVDVGSLDNPYRVGFIKPSGFARDVAVQDDFVYIAASHEGLVVADVQSALMPIVSSLDLLGVANRVVVDGRYAYVTEMAGDGFESRLTVVDITDPYNPTVDEVVELQPQQADWVPDGAYDVSIGGGRAYVSVHMSSQADDSPSGSMVEIINLEQRGQLGVDATIPVPIHREATADDFGARGMVYGRGALHVAGGRQGLARVTLPHLMVVDHTPERNARQVPTDLDKVVLEFSAPLPEGLATQEPGLRDHVQVLKLDGQLPEDTSGLELSSLSSMLGTDVTDQFGVDFAPVQYAEGATGDEAAVLDGLENHRFVQLEVGAEGLQANAQYVVVIAEGLPGAGALGALPSDYVFTFYTVPVDGANTPHIVDVDPARGPVSGNQTVRICASGLGDGARVRIGGREVDVEATEIGVTVGLETCDRVTITTPPSVPGPATIEVISEAGLVGRRVGGYMYTDELYIDFVEPAVVRLTDAGESDVVEVVGYGFHRDMELSYRTSGSEGSSPGAWQSVGSDRWTLLSSGRLRWSVPILDAGGYRGFIDLKLEDDPDAEVQLRALLYGRMEINRALRVSATPQDPDARSPGFLPNGTIVDIEPDEDLSIIYVLGAPAGAVNTARPEESPRSFMAMVGYATDQLPDAAPRHGLGYYNPPGGIMYRSMALGQEHIYVSASY